MFPKSGKADVACFGVGSAEVLDGLKNMPFAPSAQMQHVPYDAENDEGDSDSDLDVRISG